MARPTPVEFKMYFKVDFDTIIRGHHVYKFVWTPVVDEILECEQDTHTEAKEHDENAIGVYKPPGPKGTKQPNSKKTLAGHVSIGLSCLLNNFLRRNTENNLFAKVSGKRKGNCEEELPKKPVGRLSVDRLPTGYRQLTDSKPTGYQHDPETILTDGW